MQLYCLRLTGQLSIAPQFNFKAPINKRFYNAMAQHGHSAACCSIPPIISKGYEAKGKYETLGGTKTCKLLLLRSLSTQLLTDIKMSPVPPTPQRVFSTSLIFSDTSLNLFKELISSRLPTRIINTRSSCLISLMASQLTFPGTYGFSLWLPAVAQNES